jgi:type IV pilus assembly protein PilC
MANNPFSSLFRKVSMREKALFTRALSAMVSAGLPLIRGLELLGSQTKNKYFFAIIADLVAHLEQGEQLSVALNRYHQVFGEVYISSVRAAEASGKFEQVLKDLADQQEKEYKFASAIKAAIAYPVFILVTMIVTGAILIVVVIPKLEDVFTQSNITLPLATRILISVASFLQHSWLILILIIIAIVVWVRYYLRTDSGQAVWGELILKIPAFKDLFIAIYMTRFARTLGMLTNAGVPIIEAVKIIAQVMDNAVYRKTLTHVAGQLERGVPMSEPISKSRYFPPIVSQMILVGEQTGKLDEVVTSLSEFFDDEVNKKVSLVTSLLEPILLVLVGVGVGTIVFAIIIPIYQISASVQ